MFVPDPANSTNPPLVYFIHTDHIDTPRVVVDRNNNLRWRWMAEPFGTTAPQNKPGRLHAEPEVPGGQYFDQESGLAYNMNRYLDNSLNRYTQSDPIGLQAGINTYAYVGGNPVSGIDPNGLMEWDGYVSVLNLSGGGAGAGVAIGYQLRSKCLRGQRWVVSGHGIGASVAIGWKIGATTSAMAFEDGLDYINPYIFNGRFEIVNLASGSFGGGYGYSGMNLGGAHSKLSWSSYNGRDLTIAGGAAGTSIVDKAIAEVCGCDEK
jgi:RHS repeat-associated protein